MDVKSYISLIEKSKDILVVTPPDPSDDILSSAFAAYHYIKKHNKEVTHALPEKKPHRLSFLKDPNNVTDSLSGLREFVLVFNTKRNKIMDVKSEEGDGEFVVRITPEKGSIDPRDFSFVPADFKHDLIIVIGAPTLESLGKLYQSNTDLFFEVPKINIDNKSANENFGQANIVDMTASSVSEICANLFFEHNEKHFDHHIAQALLTGIVAETQSFQKPTTTPKAMVTAAKLMKYKADQAVIIRHLFKTKSFSFLKLWGRAMARLDWNKEKKVAWSLISTEDLVQSRADESDIPYVLEEIQRNFMEGQVFAVFYSEDPKTTLVQIHFTDEARGKLLAESYGTESTSNTLKIRLENKNLLEAEKEFLEKIEELE